MFKEKFREEMNNILLDDTVKAVILEKIKSEQANPTVVPTKKSYKKRWITAIAATLTLIIVSLSVFGLPQFSADYYIMNTDSSDEQDSLVSKESILEENDSNLNENSITASENLPKTTTYDEVNNFYEEIDALQTAQEEHISYEEPNTKYSNSVALGSNGNTSASSATPKNYTETNIQVEGIEEGDIVKTDGKYIYICRFDDEINITKATNGKLSKTSCIKIKETPNYELYDDDKYPTVKDLYIYGNTLVAIVSATRKSKSYEGVCTVAMLFDVSNPKSPVCIKQCVQTGSYESTRIIGDKLYVFSNNYAYQTEKIKKDDGVYEEKKVWHLPQFGTDNKVLKFIEEENLYIFDGDVNPEYFSVVSIDLDDCKIIDKKSVVGGSDNVYVCGNSIYAVSSELNYFKTEGEYKPKTYIIKFIIDNGKITPFAKAEVKGSVHNQFLMDEYDGYFRIITTTRRYKVICSCGFRSTAGVESNDVFVFDKYLKLVGSVNGIAKDEIVTSSRFMGKIGYFCTTPLNQNKDPFFAVDFSNPKKPKIVDSLEFPGSVDYLHPYGDNMMLGIGETENSNNVKLIMFDVSNPKNIKQLFTLDTSIPYGYLNFDSHSGHKMVNILKEKDIICFPGDSKYNLFTFSRKKGFATYKNKSFATQTNKWGETMNNFYSYQIRGIFIDNYLYVCNYNGIISYAPFENGQKIKGIRF